MKSCISGYKKSPTAFKVILTPLIITTTILGALVIFSSARIILNLITGNFNGEEDGIYLVFFILPSIIPLVLSARGICLLLNFRDLGKAMILTLSTLVLGYFLLLISKNGFTIMNQREFDIKRDFLLLIANYAILLYTISLSSYLLFNKKYNKLLK